MKHEQSTLERDLDAWLASPNWNDARTYLREHRHLLTGAAEEMLSAMARGHTVRAQDESTRSIEAYLRLLRLCREHGIDEGFGLFLAPSQTRLVAEEKAYGLEIPTPAAALLAEARTHTRPEDLLRRASLLDQALDLVDPVSHPGLRAMLLGERGNALALSTVGDRETNLVRAIASYRDALGLVARETASADWAAIQHHLGAALYDQARLDVTAEPRAILDEAISAYRDALTVRNRDTDPIPWASTQFNLAIALHDRSSLEIGAARREMLDEAIAAYRDTLTVSTRDFAPVQWGELQHDLGMALQDRADLEAGERRRAILDEAIAAYQAALTVRTRVEMSLEWASTQNALASALCERARLEIGATRRASLDEAVQAFRAALDVTSRDVVPARWASTQNNLGTALCDRARLEAGGRRGATLDEAIAAYRDALGVTTRDTVAAEWAMMRNNLGIALVERAGLEAGDRRSEMLDEAVVAYRDALGVRTRESSPFPWAFTQINLAVALRNRSRLETGTARRASLEEAVVAYRAALTVFTCEETPSQWGMLQNDLAVALAERAGTEAGERRRASLDEAATAYRDVLEVAKRAEVPDQWALIQNNLAIVLTTRAALESEGVRRETLAEAVAASRASLAVRTRQASPVDWAMTCNNLGNSLRNLALVEPAQPGEKRRAILDQALAAYRSALRVFTRETMPNEWGMVQNNLASSLKERAWLGTQATRRMDIDAAVDAYRGAMGIFTRETSPIRHRNAAQAAARLLFDECEWERAAELYAAALGAQDDLFLLGLTARDRAESLESGDDLAGPLAYAQMRMLTPSTAPQVRLQAARALERGRARASGEALMRERAQLEAASRVAPDVLRRFTEAADLLARYITRDADDLGDDDTEVDYERTAPAILAAASAARRGYEDAVAAMRKVLPDFLLAEDPLTEAATLLRPDERLVYVASTPHGAVALMLSPAPTGVDVQDRSPDFDASSPMPAMQAWWDTYLTTDVIIDLLDQRDDDGQMIGGLLAPHTRRSRFNEDLRRVMLGLGARDGVLAQLAQGIREQAIGRVILVPCGVLGLLPLHAALVPASPENLQESDLVPLQDIAQVTYAPSARIWTASRRRTLGRERAVLGGPHALVVGDPFTSASPLEGAATEAELVRDLMLAAAGEILAPSPARPYLDGEAATLRAVMTTLSRYRASLTHAHFACHGIVDLAHPERSGLLLANDARLTVRDLRDLDELRFQDLRLVMLSACQTGLPGVQLPDEVVGLPTAWLLAGAADVVGSLWPVSDSATVALMQKFYEVHLVDGLEPGEALWLAQRWLRGLPQWREEFAEEGALRAARGLDASDVVRDIAGTWREVDPLAIEPSEGEPPHEGDIDSQWEAARHWAAFAHYGA